MSDQHVPPQSPVAPGNPAAGYQPGPEMPRSYPAQYGPPPNQPPYGPPRPRRAPGAVIAAALLFGLIFGGSALLIGGGVAMGAAVLGDDGGSSSGAGLAAAIAMITLALVIAAVAISVYIWKGHRWAQVAGIALSALAMTSSFALSVWAAEGTSGGVASGVGSAACYLVLMLLLAGLLIVPESSRDWFDRRARH